MKSPEQTTVESESQIQGNHMNNGINQKIKEQLIDQQGYPMMQNQVPHFTNFLCFHNCSIWNLAINSIFSKKIHRLPQICGKIASQTNINGFSAQNLPQNILELLPLDLQLNQRFVLDPNQPKTNLNLQFDFNRVHSNFSNVSKTYSVTTFEFNINANLHGHCVFKNNINFKVKGFDILKAIQMKFKEITNDSNRNPSPTESNINGSSKNIYNVNVFNNIQCSFNVSFTVSNMNIAKYISCSELNMNFNFDICEIKIVKLNFIYCLPLSVFYRRNQFPPSYNNAIRNYQIMHKPNIHISNMQNHNGKQQVQMIQNMQGLNNYQNLQNNYSHMQQKIRDPNQIQKNFLPKPNINLTPYSEIIQQTRGKQNFSNWHSFMTSTTPVILEVESIHVMRDIFYSLKKAALFGVKCTLQLKDTKYTHVNYYPAISTINIFLNEQLPICLNLFNNNNNNNNFGDYENSFDSKVSSSSVPGLTGLNIVQNSNNNYNFEVVSPNASFSSITETGVLNLSNISSNSMRSINYEEKMGNVFNIKNLCEQIRDIEKSEPDLQLLTLEDIDKESWFSLIWYPMQTFQTQLKTHGTFIQDTKNSPILKVFYQFHQGRLTHKGNFLTVIGILPLTKTFHEQILNENFWFKDRNDMDNEEHFKYNKKLYYSLVEQAKLIEL